MFLEANVYFCVYPENKNPLQTVDLQGVCYAETVGFEPKLVFRGRENAPIRKLGTIGTCWLFTFP